ncbi:MAG: hypothetical protein GYA66_08495 [Phyllobacteriaceae bacterium]|nr:hypothetical protein [Phyllobacteriaceae bacterium]
MSKDEPIFGVVQANTGKTCTPRSGVGLDELSGAAACWQPLGGPRTYERTDNAAKRSRDKERCHCGFNSAVMTI